MNEISHNELIQYYLDICAKDARKGVLLLKSLDIIVEGMGPRFDELGKVLDKVDECALIKASTFRMNLASGDKSDPLAAAIGHISD